ncbi:sensor histidine kinase [Actinomadura sp. 3N407]|uniref:sensor histidine kinase n=1 Tax=Actinomadura sp. 3N407 TaxID=3457423 RepID=UPI003FCD9FC2
MSSRPVHDQCRHQAIRDLHDALGSRITIIYVQAAGALALSGTSDGFDRATAALAAIKTTSKELAAEVHALVDSLNTAEPSSTAETVPGRPGAGLNQVAALIEEMASCGLAIHLDASGERPVPPAVDQAAYRIVQESVTNILRHAGPTTVSVRIIHETDAVLVEVTNARPNRDGHHALSRGGHGIIGMRQRAEALGGSLQAEPLQDGGFRVYARLPTGTPDVLAKTARGSAADTGADMEGLQDVVHPKDFQLNLPSARPRSLSGPAATGRS